MSSVMEMRLLAGRWWRDEMDELELFGCLSDESGLEELVPTEHVRFLAALLE